MEERKIGQKTIRLVRGDITDYEVDAFVHDITEDLKLGSGFGGAIQMRGGIVIQKELDKIGTLPVGQAVATTAGKLKAKQVIHVNGPKFHEDDVEGKLKSATLAALKIADEKELSTLAFPAVGAGLYQVPMDLCARVMVDTVSEYLAGETNLQEVLFVLGDTREIGPFKTKIAEGS